MKRISFTGKEFLGLAGDAVYVFWRGRKAVYIGRSSRGLHRALFDRTHSRAARAKEISTRLEIFCCKDGREAAQLEMRLIKRHQPRLNVLWIKSQMAALKARAISERLDRMRYGALTKTIYITTYAKAERKRA